ncbi:hypothetical protein C8K44_13319 [Aminobacter sp. AP02]|nr:hypothetical protein C8K44_13319 [Aminobacter sp. AP02]
MTPKRAVSQVELGEHMQKELHSPGAGEGTAMRLAKALQPCTSAHTCLTVSETVTRATLSSRVGYEA